MSVRDPGLCWFGSSMPDEIYCKLPLPYPHHGLVETPIAQEKHVASDNLDFKPGLYKHYKGGLYQALTLAGSSDDETSGVLMVVYVCLYTYKGGPFVRVRSLRSWNHVVSHEGKAMPRFEYLGSGIDTPAIVLPSP